MLTRTKAGAAALALVVAGLTATGIATAPTAVADGPGSGGPWYVTLGDSYISGEAGRWAGNTGGTDEYRIDALGGAAYNDNADHTAETVNRCHRSLSAPAYFGGSAIQGYNLACSGARTSTHWSDDRFKPGIDQYADANGNWGQAGLLREFAKTHNVTMVSLSIGGNDFGFADTVQQCVTDFLFSPATSPDLCQDDSSVTARFTPSAVATARAAIKQAILNVNIAMQQAGYTSSQWTLLLQNYPMPIERSTEARYGDSGYTAQSTGGCGFWKADLDWANNYVMPLINSAIWGAADDAGLTNLKRLDLTHAMDNHKLCQRGVMLAEDAGYTNPWDPEAPNKMEWINQIHTVSTATTNFYVQESLHPNYWGQLALRNCIRQAWNNGAVRSGACQPSYAWGKNSLGEPNMTFSDTYASGYQPPRRGFNIGGAPSRKCVDIPGNSTSVGTVVTLYTCNGQANQNYQYNLANKQIQTHNSGFSQCLGLQNESTGAGTRVVIQGCNSSNPRQRWTMNPNQTIVNDVTGQCLDANGGGTGNGTQLLIWWCGGQSNQTWWF